MKKILVRQGDEFLKYHGPTVEQDWGKVKLLEGLTEKIAGLRSPRPLRLDIEKECISYEWLGDLPRMITLRDDSLDDAICRLGQGLAQLHESSVGMAKQGSPGAGAELPLDMPCFGDADRRKIRAKLPVAFFHGDCWHGNVLVDADQNCVLIDPIQSPWLFGGRQFDFANSIVDLATLHMSLLVSFRILPLLTLDIEKQLALGDLLLDSYLGHFNAGSLRPQVLALSETIARNYVSTYPKRINTLVGWVKLWLSNRIISDAKRRNSVE
mgnify:CR=1 FL=1